MGPLEFLVIDDDTLVQRALAAVLRKHGVCTPAHSAKAALSELDQKPWDGILVDVRLGDGSGLDVLAAARKLRVRAPALVLTGIVDNATANRAAQLDARIVGKPCGTQELAPFMSDVKLFKTGDRIDAVVELARYRWGLTEREVVIIHGALRGRTRSDNFEAMGITRNTYKTHVRKLLDKADYTNLSSLAIDLLAER